MDREGELGKGCVWVPVASSFASERVPRKQIPLKATTHPERIRGYLKMSNLGCINNIPAEWQVTHLIKSFALWYWAAMIGFEELKYVGKSLLCRDKGQPGAAKYFGHARLNCNILARCTDNVVFATYLS